MLGDKNHWNVHFKCIPAMTLIKVGVGNYKLTKAPYRAANWIIGVFLFPLATLKYVEYVPQIQQTFWRFNFYIVSLSDFDYFISFSEMWLKRNSYICLIGRQRFCSYWSLAIADFVILVIDIIESDTLAPTF